VYAYVPGCSNVYRNVPRALIIATEALSDEVVYRLALQTQVTVSPMLTVSAPGSNT
jgi:hypothetical protein